MMSGECAVGRQKGAKTDREDEANPVQIRRGFTEGSDVVLQRKSREYVNSEKEGGRRSGEEGLVSAA